jgi:hypothetical protein
MPAILNTNEDILAWLDYVRVNVDQALSLLDRSIECMKIDSVSNYVFKKSNTDSEVTCCIVDIVHASIVSVETNIDLSVLQL